MQGSALTARSRLLASRGGRSRLANRHRRVVAIGVVLVLSRLDIEAEVRLEGRAAHLQPCVREVWEGAGRRYWMGA